MITLQSTNARIIKLTINKKAIHFQFLQEKLVNRAHTAVVEKVP